MNTLPELKPGEVTLDDIERVIQQARKMRSQALGDIVNALRRAIGRGIGCMLSHLRAAVRGHVAEKCA